MSQTSHFLSHKPGDYERIVGFMSQETSHSSFLNHETSVYGDGRDEYRSHISHSISHKPGGSGRLLGDSVASSRIFNSNFIPYNRVRQYSSKLGYPQDDFPWGGRV